jgi:2-keto-4-pentenoate hydratase
MPSVTDLDALGRRLHEAYASADPIPPPAASHDLSVADAYAVQAAALVPRLDAGATPVGYKLGFTNERIQSAWGFDRPAHGRLLSDAVVTDGVVATDDLIGPRVEAELAVVLDAPLSGPTTVGEVLAATRAVVPALEVVDDRTTGETRATDAIADNALAARFVPGEVTHDPAGRDWAFAGARTRLDGRPVETGVGADVLGHPARAVAWLAERLGERGDRIEAGETVSTGSLTTAVPVGDARTATAAFGDLGRVTVTFA